MATINRTESGDFVKINRPTAKKLYFAGQVIITKGSKERFSSVLYMDGSDYDHDEQSFDTWCNAWEYYNKQYYGSLQFYRYATKEDWKGVRMH